MTLQDAKFALAQEVARAAREIVAPKESRWIALIQDRLFRNLIEPARAAEGRTDFKAAEIFGMIRVYEPPTQG